MLHQLRKLRLTHGDADSYPLDILWIGLSCDTNSNLPTYYNKKNNATLCDDSFGYAVFYKIFPFSLPEVVVTTQLQTNLVKSQILNYIPPLESNWQMSAWNVSTFCCFVILRFALMFCEQQEQRFAALNTLRTYPTITITK